MTKYFFTLITLLSAFAVQAQQTTDSLAQALMNRAIVVRNFGKSRL